MGSAMRIISTLPVEELENKIRELEKDNAFYICGYGLNGKIIEAWLDDKNLGSVSFIDKKERRTKSGSSILSYEEFSKVIDEKTIVLISSNLVYSAEMECELEKCGLGREHIFVLDEKTMFSVIEEVNNSAIKKTGRMMDLTLKDINKGRRAFVIGNGPSLQIRDLECLENEITFATNDITFAFSKTKWRPTYYLLQDRVTANVNFADNNTFEELCKSCKKVFCSNLTSIYERFADKEIDNLYFYRFALNESVVEGECLPFSTNPEKGIIHSGGTCLYTIFQIAYYMGIRELYLLGVDCDYANTITDNGGMRCDHNKRNHASFVPDQIEELTVANVERMHLAYVSADYFMKNHGAKIINATRGGALEVFERVDFDALLNKGEA